MPEWLILPRLIISMATMWLLMSMHDIPTDRPWQAVCAVCGSILGLSYLVLHGVIF